MPSSTITGLKAPLLRRIRFKTAARNLSVGGLNGASVHGAMAQTEAVHCPTLPPPAPTCGATPIDAF